MSLIDFSSRSKHYPMRNQQNVKTSHLAMVKKVGEKNMIPLNPPTKFHGDRFSSFSVILLTNQPKN